MFLKVSFKQHMHLCAMENKCTPVHHKNLYLACQLPRNSKSFHGRVSGSKGYIHGISAIVNTVAQRLRDVHF